jgi:hypothetical protein
MSRRAIADRTIAACWNDGVTVAALFGKDRGSPRRVISARIEAFIEPDFPI